jgi:hypothetical protein
VEIFLCCILSRLTLEPTQPPIQTIKGALILYLSLNSSHISTYYRNHTETCLNRTVNKCSWSYHENFTTWSVVLPYVTCLHTYYRIMVIF